MKHTNAKSHRLLLNTTPEGRARIQTLTLESGAATESALLRQAFDFYAMLHPHLAAGAEVFMRSAAGDDAIDLDISATWDGPVEPTTSQSAGIRQRMELKLDPAQREQLDRLVELGAAPTLTALAGEALTAYGYYVRYRNQGMLLYLRNKEGAETLVTPPVARERIAAVAKRGVVQPMGIGYVQPDRVPVREVLRQEAELDADILIIDTPFSTCERFAELRDEIVRTIHEHHFAKNQTQIQFVRADRAGIKEMQEFIETYLAGRLEISSLTQSQQGRINNLVSQLEGSERISAEIDPVWALARPRVISRKTQQELGPAVIGRLFDTPRWYARLKDGSYWGYEFIANDEFHVTADETFMNPMDPDRVKSLIGMLSQLTDPGWNMAQKHMATLNAGESNAPAGSPSRPKQTGKTLPANSRV